MINWAISYFTQFLCYYLCYRIIFHFKFKSWRWFLGVNLGMCLLAEGLIKLELFGLPSMVITLCVLLGMLLLAAKKRLYGMALFPIALILTGSINILTSYVLSMLFQVPYREYLAATSWSLITDCIALLVFFLCCILTRKQWNADMIQLRLCEYLFLLIGAACLFVMVAATQGLMKGEEEIFLILRKPFAICLIVVGLFLMGGLLWQSYIRNEALRMQADNELYRQFIEWQEMNVKAIIEADDKLRSFRHDVNAHILALESCIEEGDQAALRQYLQRIKQETKAKNTRRYSGIAAVDAIIGEWHNNAVELGVDWNWDGKLPQNINIDLFDFCVLISNLLSNAVEAAGKVASLQNAFVKANVGSIQNRIVIRVANSCLGDAEKNLKFQTTKPDSCNHGYGMKSIHRIIESVNGEIIKKVENGVCKIEVII